MLAGVERGDGRQEAHVTRVGIELQVRVPQRLHSRPVLFLDCHANQRLVRLQVVGVGINCLGERIPCAGLVIHAELRVTHRGPRRRKLGIRANRLLQLRDALLVIGLLLAHLAKTVLVGFLRVLGSLQRQRADHVAHKAVQTVQGDDPHVVVAHRAVHAQLQVVRAVAGKLGAQGARAEIEAPWTDLADPLCGVRAARADPAAQARSGNAGVRRQHGDVAAHLEAEPPLGIRVALGKGVPHAHSLDDHGFLGRQTVVGYHLAMQVQRALLLNSEWVLVLSERIVPLVLVPKRPLGLPLVAPSARSLACPGTAACVSGGTAATAAAATLALRPSCDRAHQHARKQDHPSRRSHTTPPIHPFG